MFGSVFAHEMERRGKRCMVIEKRPHIGGNCYTERKDGMDVHAYGPHIFHTDSKALWDYMGRFCRMFSYRHQVRACFEDQLYSFPINLRTLRQVFDTTSNERALAAMRADREPFIGREAKNMEEWCLSRVGPTLYRMFIYGYTLKHWRKPPRELDASVIKRLPFREIEDDNYYRHRYQGLPSGGYTQVFEGLLAGMEVRLNTDYFEDRDYWDRQARKTVYTGEIDRFFDYAHGRLEWRSLIFEESARDVSRWQSAPVINYTEETIPCTRVVDYSYFMEEQTQPPGRTVVTTEYPADPEETGEAYYPVPSAPNLERHARYKAMAAALSDRYVFGGRLARYVYIDMAPTIRMALNTVEREEGLQDGLPNQYRAGELDDTP